MAPPLNTYSPGWCVWPWEITPHITIFKLCSWGGLVEMGPEPSAPQPSSYKRPALRLARAVNLTATEGGKTACQPVASPR